MLNALTEKEIVSVAQAVGVYGPDGLLHEIIHQSLGKPGLTVTICQALLSQPKENLPLVTTLPREARRAIKEVGFEQGIEALALFALGGEKGMEISVVADALHMSSFTLQERMQELAFGGLVETRANDVIVVTPSRLGQTLLKEHFFAKPPSMARFASLIDRARSRGSVLTTLMAVKMLGGAVDTAWLRESIEEFPQKLWVATEKQYGGEIPSWRQPGLRSELLDVLKVFAHLGREESEWVIARFRDFLPDLAGQLLIHSPKIFLETLFSDVGREPENLSKSLESIKGWVKRATLSTEEFMERRIIIFATVVGERAIKDVDLPIAAELLAICLDVQHDSTYQKAGEPDQIILHRGVAGISEVSKLAQLWSDARPLIRRLDAHGLAKLYKILHVWVFPSSIASPIPDDLAKEYETIARKVLLDHLEDTVDWCTGRVLRRYLRHLGVEDSALKDDFADTIFPSQDYDGDYHAAEKCRTDRARQLGVENAEGDPAEICWKIANLLKRLQSLFPSFSSDQSLSFFDGVFSKTSKQDEWLHYLLQNSLNFRSPEPYLQKLADTDSGRFEYAMEDVLRSGKYPEMVVRFGLKHFHSSARLWREVLPVIASNPALAEGPLLRKEVNESLYRDLLSPQLGLPPIVISCVDPDLLEGESDLMEVWKSAVVEQGNHYPIEKIGSRFPDVTMRWLERELKYGYFGNFENYANIISNLPEDQQREIRDKYSPASADEEE